MVLNPGQTLHKGKYTVEQELRRGLYDISYMTKRSDGDRWLIKVLNPQVLASLPNDAERDRLKTQFWQEAVRLAKFSDTPHIAKVEMPFSEGDLLCLPVECLDGRSLGKRSQRRLTEKTALEYVQQVGEALAAVHKQGKGIVHRDVRPDNILLRIVDGGVEAVLTNFILAMDCDTEITRTRTREATDGFSPLELYGSGKTVGPYTDVYSLAATLYELLTGEVPPSVEKRVEERKLGNATLIAPQALNRNVSTPVSEAILAGMAISSEERPQSVADWLTLLKTPSKPSRKSRDKQKLSGAVVKDSVDWTKWQAIWGAVAAVIALIGIVASIWMAREPEFQPPTADEPATAEPATE